MKKTLETALTFAGSAGVVATMGVVYSTNKRIALDREIRNREFELKRLELEQQGERLEMDKFKMNLLSKFDPELVYQKPVQTPVSDAIDSKIEASKILKDLPNLDDKFNVNSPVEGLDIYIPLETVQLIGVSVGCLTLTVVSSLLMIYLNNVIISKSENRLESLPSYLKPLAQYLKLSSNLSNKFLYLVIFICFLTLGVLSVYLMIL